MDEAREHAGDGLWECAGDLARYAHWLGRRLPDTRLVALAEETQAACREWDNGDEVTAEAY